MPASTLSVAGPLAAPVVTALVAAMAIVTATAAATASAAGGGCGFTETGAAAAGLASDNLDNCSARAEEPSALVQTRQAAAQKRRQVACPPGAEITGRRDLVEDIEVANGVCEVSNFATQGSILVSGSGSLVVAQEVGGPRSQVGGDIAITDGSGRMQLAGLDVAGSVTINGVGADISVHDTKIDGVAGLLVENIQGSLTIERASMPILEVAGLDGGMILAAAQIPEVAFVGSGDLDIRTGCHLESVSAEASGSVRIQGPNATTVEVSLKDCGDLSAGAGANLGDMDVEFSGRIHIGGNAVAMGIKAISSQELVINSASVAEVEVVGMAGTVDLSGIDVSGYVKVKECEGDIVLDGVTMAGLECELVQGRIVASGSHITEAKLIKNSGGVALIDNVLEKLECKENQPAPEVRGNKLASPAVGGQCR